VFLCIAALVCHTMVLTGNMKTAGALKTMGHSVDGWANVGLAMSEALHEELDAIMGNVTQDLTDSINRTLSTQVLLDQVLSMFGSTAVGSAAKAAAGGGAAGAAAGAMAAATGAAGKAAGAASNAAGNVGLMQVHQSDNPMAAVMETVVKALSAVPEFQTALESFTAILHNVKPALLQVGQMLDTFGDKIQATIEAFGTTLDRVQKLFDQVMSKISPTAGEGEDLMIHDTFNLFDVSGTGFITVDDLHECANLYAMNALAGDKAKHLVAAYDKDGDDKVSPEEFPAMMADSTIPGAMATVLRSYAKKLSQISGNVAAARMRDEVAQAVVQYFQLVCSKNLTKVSWVSQMLTNGTLPMEFTADIMSELGLAADDPNVLTSTDVGQIVIGYMMTLDQNYTTTAFNVMSTADFWTAEGFNPDDQPKVVKQVKQWMDSGSAAVTEMEKKKVSLLTSHAQKVSLFSSYRLSAEQKAESEALYIRTQENMRKHLAKRASERHELRRKLYDTEEKQLLLHHLLGGVAAIDGGAFEKAQQALANGVIAKPETLQFAQWLASNASSTADRFQSQSMNYTGESSSKLDAFNTQVQGMVKKISTFLNIMREYTTPAGVEKLENMLADFASQAMDDVFQVVEKKVMDVLNNTMGNIEDAKDKAKEAVTNGLTLAQTGRRLHVHQVKERTQRVVSWQPAGNVAAAKNAAAGASANPAGAVNAAKGAAGGVPNAAGATSAAKGAAGSLPNPVGSVPAGVGPPSGGLPTSGVPGMPAGPPGIPGGAVMPSGIWEQVTMTLRQLTNIMPLAVATLKYARKEVSAVGATLESIFKTLKEKGLGIFDKVSRLYKVLWTLYYFFLVPLTIVILFYGFWASGYFGGPQPDAKRDAKSDATPASGGAYCPPGTFSEKIHACCSTCCTCMRHCHDRQICFWSFIVLFYVIVLLIFIISILFCILAGIKIFVGSGCAQIYILNDPKVCTETVNYVATWLQTFKIHDGEVPLSMACDHFNLKTCDVISKKMMTSTILTVVGSFSATLFSFQLIFDIAILHERARWQRYAAEEGL